MSATELLNLKWLCLFTWNVKHPFNQKKKKKEPTIKAAVLNLDRLFGVKGKQFLKKDWKV